jgi:hypothetical protein
VEQRERLIKDLDSADVFLRNRATSLPTPLNEYDIEEMLDIAKICDETARILEKAIIPPCKVGDTVYKLTPNFGCIHTYEVVGFHLGDFPTLNGHKRKPYLVCYGKISSSLKHIPIDEIGKTAFFAREEAERELERRKNERDFV